MHTDFVLGLDGNLASCNKSVILLNSGLKTGGTLVIDSSVHNSRGYLIKIFRIAYMSMNIQ